MTSVTSFTRDALPSYSTPAEFLAITGVAPVHYSPVPLPSSLVQIGRRGRCIACGRRLSAGDSILTSWNDRDNATCAPSNANPHGPHTILPGYRLLPLDRVRDPQTGNAEPKSDEDLVPYVPQELWDDTDNPARRVIANLLAKVEAVKVRVACAKKLQHERPDAPYPDVDPFEISRDFSEIDEALL